MEATTNENIYLTNNNSFCLACGSSQTNTRRVGFVMKGYEYHNDSCLSYNLDKSHRVDIELAAASNDYDLNSAGETVTPYDAPLPTILGTVATAPVVGAAV
jgi:hypothetical protein